jgi:hypothetical protein
LKKDASKAADMLRTFFFERPHDRRGHFVDLLLDRLSDASPDSFSPGEIHGMLSAFADTMDHIAAESGEFTTSGRSEIWRKATRLLNQSAAGDFKNVITNGKSINWLANVVRDQGFAHGLPSGHKDYPDNQWLTRAQLDEAIQVVTKRFRELDANTIFQLPSPLDLLFCWYQLGDKTEVRKFFTDAIQSDESFLYALNALRGWASSSDIGIHHPLHKDYVAYFMNADDAKGRLERLADPMAPSSALRDKAKELLSEWADKLVN